MRTFNSATRAVLIMSMLPCALPGLAQSPTWSDDVACIVFTHCAPCHHEGGPGHFNLTSYADGYWWRNEMRDATQARFMPPWPPDPSYRSMAHERVLTQQEIDVIAAWVDAGAPEGLASNAPPPPTFSDDPVIAQPDITAIMEEYVIPASSADLYRCFVLPIDHAADRYITGLEVIPGNREMVHHVLVFQDVTGQAQVLDDEDIDPGYTSFGGIGVNGAKLIGIWVPGSDPLFMPPGMGIKLDAGADLVIQVHYPAHSTIEVDSTRVNIQFSPPGFTREVAIDPILDHILTITNGPLIIPPNEVKTFHAQYTAPIPATITAIGPHSHLLGKQMRSWAITPGGDSIPLIDIPNWDFRWQGMYQFRQPIFLPTGTVLHGEATYDNTAANPFNPNSPPQWVFLGEATTNEMMLFYFAWTYGLASDANIVVDTTAHMPHYLDCTVDLQVGVAERTELQARVWPIPAHDVVNIEGLGPGASLRMIDALGRTVEQLLIAADRYQLGVSSLARGSYVLELRSKDGRREQRVNLVLE